MFVLNCALCNELVEEPDQPEDAALCNSCAAYLDMRFAPVAEILADPGVQAAMEADEECLD